MNDTPTWRHLVLIDSVYLGVIEVVVPTEWTSTQTLKCKPVDSAPGLPLSPTYHMYTSQRAAVSRTTWLRLVKYMGALLVCAHVMEGPSHTTRIEAVPLDLLQLWNPDMPVLDIKLPPWYTDVEVDWDLLLSRTENGEDINHKQWWPLLVPRLQRGARVMRTDSSDSSDSTDSSDSESTPAASSDTLPGTTPTLHTSTSPPSTSTSATPAV
jgi:hypothetical protein